MKYFTSLLLFVLFMSAQNSGGRIIKYNNSYKKLVVEKSTIEDVKKVLGKEKEIEKTKNGHNYIYDKVIINISERTAPAITTIIITGDKEYKCPNGLAIGDKMEKLKEILGDHMVHRESYSIDFKNGFCYWIKDGLIIKIVLTGTMVDRRGKVPPN